MDIIVIAIGLIFALIGIIVIKQSNKLSSQDLFKLFGTFIGISFIFLGGCLIISGTYLLLLKHFPLIITLFY